jgi:hypothetical protein
MYRNKTSQEGVMMRGLSQEGGIIQLDWKDASLRCYRPQFYLKSEITLRELAMVLQRDGTDRPHIDFSVYNGVMP